MGPKAEGPKAEEPKTAGLTAEGGENTDEEEEEEPSSACSERDWRSIHDQAETNDEREDCKRAEREGFDD